VLNGMGNKAVLRAGCPDSGECIGGMTCSPKEFCDV
jgi:hypothetical protein